MIRDVIVVAGASLEHEREGEIVRKVSHIDGTFWGQGWRKWLVLCSQRIHSLVFS